MMENTHKISDSIFVSDRESQCSFADPAKLTFSEDGTVRFSSRYNPRWSGRLALSLTVVLLCLGAFIFHPSRTVKAPLRGGGIEMAQQAYDQGMAARVEAQTKMTIGIFSAGPAFLLLWWAVGAMRRRWVNIYLQTANSVVFDFPKRRIAFHTNFEGEPGWVALEFANAADYQAASENAKTVIGTSCADGEVEVPGCSIGSFLLSGFLLLITVAAIIAAGIVAIVAIDRAS